MMKVLKNILLGCFIFVILFMLSYLIYAHFQINSLKIPLWPKTCDAQQPISNSKKEVRVLLISGGGVSGIIPLVYLDYIEKQTHLKSAHLFDVFAGISTGGIIVASLNIPDGAGKPLYDAQEVLTAYMHISSRIMQRSMIRQFFTLNGIWGPPLDIRILNQSLRQALGSHITLKNLIKPSIFAYFNMSSSKLEFVHSNGCSNNMNFSDFPVADFLTATCAAPAIFSSVALENTQTYQKQYFVDAALIANNPFPYVFSKIIKQYPYASKYIFVYLDTGDFHIQSLNLNSKNFSRWGCLEWAASLVRILMKAHTKLIHQDVINLGLFLPPERFSYYYFSTRNRWNGFDASQENLQKIFNDAKKSIKPQEPQFKKLIQELTSD